VRAPDRHLLVTNDFPPKLGGIQSYLWELWRRLPPERFAVLTIAHPGAESFDAQQPFAVDRLNVPVLLPTRSILAKVKAAAARHRANRIVFDPALPIGVLGHRVGLPYAVVVHGAEISVPARIPLLRRSLRRVLSGAELIISAGEWTEDQARRAARGHLEKVVQVPPGVDVERFRPLSEAERLAARARLGLDSEAQLVICVTRLVPRKGVDVLVKAVAELARSRPALRLVVAGSGRQSRHLGELAKRTGSPTRFVGRLPDADLASFYGAGDVFAMPCRTRWAGLEQEGFGIVFLEAAAAGVPEVAGRSGGSHEAVLDGVTGVVVDKPGDSAAVGAALAQLIDHPQAARAMGEAARKRAASELSYDDLASRLLGALDDWAGA
jgi:phosphatidyl-myo-inositol dimannoside synthase